VDGGNTSRRSPLGLGRTPVRGAKPGPWYWAPVNEMSAARLGTAHRIVLAKRIGAEITFSSATKDPGRRI
jgi:hypothetical protein